MYIFITSYLTYIEPNEAFFDVISRIRQAVGGPEAEISKNI